MRNANFENDEDVFWDLANERSGCGCDQSSQSEEEFEQSFEIQYLAVHSKICSSSISSDFLVYLGERKNEGCLSDIGGVMWDASILLCSFILTKRDMFVERSVLEIGAGVGVPGLLISSLKQQHIDKHPASQKLIGCVCLTDYDYDVLNNLVQNVHHQFDGFDILPWFPQTQRSNNQLHIAIKALDWTHQVSESKECDISNYDPVPDVIMGSELIYLPSLVPLANMLLRYINAGTKFIYIIQNPSRYGFEEFLCLLSEFKAQGKLKFSLDPVSDEIYKQAKRVCRSSCGKFLRFCSNGNSTDNHPRSECVFREERKEFSILKIFN